MTEYIAKEKPSLKNHFQVSGFYTSSMKKEEMENG
jgi:hypothetical protein